MKTISHIVLRFALFVCFDSLHAQVAPPIEWQKSLGGSNQDYAYSIDQTFDGGFIAAGWSNSNNGDVTGNHGLLDYWITRLDPSGNLIWQKSLGGSNDDQASFIEQTTDGGFIVTGSTASNNGDVTDKNGGSDFWIVKTDANGNIQWQQTYGGDHAEEAYSIAPTSDGGYIAGGISYSQSDDVSKHYGYYDISDAWLIKLDVNGSLTWEKTLGGSGVDAINAVSQSSDGKYITAVAKVTKGSDPQITATFLSQHGVIAKTAKDLQGMIFTIVNILQGIVAGFGVLALMASVFGIINTQFISVLERTSQIGLMKALGMSRRAIARLFRYEAAWIGLIGGVLGSGLAIGLGVALNPWINKQLSLGDGNYLLIFVWWQILVLLVLLVVIAIVAGWFPARKAARLDPIEALRTE